METHPSQPLTEVTIDEDLMELVPGFVESRRKDLDQIGKFVAASDFTAIAKISHTIKGIARPYGFPTLETQARSLEEAAKANDGAKAQSILSEMQTYFSRF